MSNLNPHWLNRVINMRDHEIVEIFDTEASPQTIRRWLNKLGKAEKRSYNSRGREGYTLVVRGTWAALKNASRRKANGSAPKDDAPKDEFGDLRNVDEARDLDQVTLHSNTHAVQIFDLD